MKTYTETKVYVVLCNECFGEVIAVYTDKKEAIAEKEWLNRNAAHGDEYIVRKTSLLEECG